MIFKTLLLSAVAATFATTATADVVESLDGLSETSTYIITNGRGGLITTGTAATQCTLKAKSSGSTDNPATDDTNNTWVFIQSPNFTSTYYMYNVGSQKFLYPSTPSGGKATPNLSSTVDCASQRFTITKDAKSETIYDVAGTYNFKISPVSISDWCFAISGASGFGGYGFGATSTYGTDAGGRFNFTAASTITSEDLSKLKSKISEAEETYKNNELTTKINSIKTTLDTYAGKVGYPSTEAYSTFKTAIEATDATYDTKTAAITALLAKANITLPTDGQAYYIRPVNKGVANTATTYYLCTNSSDKLHFTSTASSTAIFYAHKVGEKFIFTNSAGKYMTMRAADDKSVAKQTNGVLSDYAACCQFSLFPFYYTGTADYCSNSDVTTASVDYLGLMLLQGALTDDASDLHYLMVNTSQASNDSPFHNGNKEHIYYTTNGNTCAFYFEEADQENAFKATEMKVGEDTYYLGSYSSPFPVVLPDGLTAYKVSEAGETASLQPIDGTVIPANTGVIISAPSTDQVIPTARTTETLATVEDNKLEASTGEAVAASTKAFILGRDASSLAANFYILSSTNRTIKQYKAYLNLTASSANQMVLSFGGSTTGIQQAAGIDAAQTKAVYDLSGRRVSKPTHGFYIVNGKKTLVK